MDLDELVTPQVLQALRDSLSKASVTGSPPGPRDELAARIEILCARGDSPYREHRSAWNAYVEAAAGIGMFEGKSGEDLRARLTGEDPNKFRSALSECAASRSLRRLCGLEVIRNKTGPDLLARREDVSAFVEVKAPLAPPSPRSGFSYSTPGHRVLAPPIKDANSQFSKDDQNVLLLAPSRLFCAYGPRHELVQAYIGEEKIHLPFNPEKGQIEGEPFSDYVFDGKLVRYDKAKGAPRFTRVSAVLLLDCGDNPFFLWPYAAEPALFVLHNPFAARPLDVGFFQGVPQMSEMEPGALSWDDGAELRS